MPEWLLKPENYLPRTDQDSYLQKSILSILAVIAKIKAHGTWQEGRIKIHSAWKIVGTFLLVLLISLSSTYSFTLIALVYLLVAMSFLSGQKILQVLRISLVATLFAFFILLPSYLWGNYYSLWVIPGKVFASVSAVNLLAHSTRWHLLTASLKKFRVPDIFILVLDIAIKYIVTLGELSLNLLYALKLRSVGSNDQKMIAFSGVAGTLYMKSHEMAREMVDAMACRGFTGEYEVNTQWKLTWADLGFLLILASLVGLFVWLEIA